MCDLSSFFASHDQPRVGQGREDRFKSSFVFGALSEFGECSAAAGVLCALAQLGEAQENAAGNRLLFGCKLLVNGYGSFGNCTTHAAGVGVAFERESVLAPALPRLKQRV